MLLFSISLFFSSPWLECVFGKYIFVYKIDYKNLPFVSCESVAKKGKKVVYHNIDKQELFIVI